MRTWACMRIKYTLKWTHTNTAILIEQERLAEKIVELLNQGDLKLLLPSKQGVF